MDLNDGRLNPGMKRLRELLSDPTPRDGALVDEMANVNGAFRLDRISAKDGTCETLVDDPNLVVTLGRRVMSRLITGATGSPNILRTRQIGFRVVRDTTNSPTDAWISFHQVAGTNTFRLTLNATIAAVDTEEYETEFVGGQKTLSTIVSEINAVTGWTATTVNGLGSSDATTIVQTPRTPCLGDDASYTDITDDPDSAGIPIIASTTDAITTDSIANLKITRLRFGTQGHQTDAATLGKDVLAADSYLTAALRAVDINESAASSDYIATTASYPQPAHAQFEASLAVDAANGLNISEAGLFTDADYMVARKNFGQITKSNLFSLRARWILIF